MEDDARPTHLRLAHGVSRALAEREFATAPGTVAVQSLEIATDALDISAVRPFWKAITGYVDEPGPSDPAGGLVDPNGRGCAIWFQQMDAPRPQRNRIHLDIDVPHDAAAVRIDAALAAGAHCAAIGRRPRSGCWPTQKATRPAFVHGRAGLVARSVS